MPRRGPLLIFIACAAAGEDAPLESGRTILFGTPVLRTRLMNYLPSHVDEDVHRNALNDAVLQAWAEHLRKWRGDEATDYERNNAFYGFQLEHMGAKDHRQHPAGWIACEAGQLLLTAFTAAAQSYLSHVAENVGVVRPDVSPDHLHVWASLHQPCSTHPRHVHAGASLSGVYYVRIPPLRRAAAA